MDIAVVGAGVSLALDADGVIAEARRGPGRGRAHLPAGRDAAGAALVGASSTDEALDKLDAAARAACNPISDKRGTIDYRTKIAGVLARRAATIAYRQGGGPHDEAPRHRHRERRSGRVPHRSRHDAARRAARRAWPHRLQGRLRLGRLRRLQRHRRRAPGLLLPDAGRRGRGPADRDHRGPGPGRRICIRCSRSSSSMPRCNAASARRACWSPPRRCWTPIPIRPRKRRATGWPATSAAAPATTR